MRLVYLSLALLIVVAAVYVHGAAGLTLPIPWGDEAYFVWQARAFARWSTFVAPELDATRPLFLLPFVHGAVLGVAFKVFGYSLELARDVSLLFTLVGFACLAWAVRRHAAAPAVLALIGAFLLNPRFVALANNARMEAFFFAAVCAALTLLMAGRSWLAIALLAATPMIHPNGVLLLVPVAAYAWWSGTLRGTRLVRADWIMFAVAATLWLANGLYALAYWDGFVHETALRFGETVEKHGGWSQFRGWNLAGLALILGTFAVSHRRLPRVAPLPVFALGFWLCSRIRIEQWYEVFNDLAFLLVSLALIELAAETAAARWPERARMRSLTAAGAALVLLALHYVNGRVEGPRGYLAELQANGMRVAPKGAYFQPADHRAVAAVLDALAPGCRVTVEVYPWGDGLLLADLAEDRVTFQVPYFDPLFQPAERWAWGYAPTPAPVPDLYIVRESRHHPGYLKPREGRVLARALAQSGVAQSTVFHTRDSTEIWHAIARPRPPSAKC